MRERDIIAAMLSEHATRCNTRDCFRYATRCQYGGEALYCDEHGEGRGLVDTAEAETIRAALAWLAAPDIDALNRVDAKALIPTLGLSPEVREWAEQFETAGRREPPDKPETSQWWWRRFDEGAAWMLDAWTRALDGTLVGNFTPKIETARARTETLRRVAEAAHVLAGTAIEGPIMDTHVVQTRHLATLCEALTTLDATKGHANG